MSGCDPRSRERRILAQILVNFSIFCRFVERAKVRAFPLMSSHGRQHEKRALRDGSTRLFWCCWLAAQAEVGDELAVALEVFVLEIAQKAPALSDLHEQAAAAVMILLVDLQMLGQLVDRRSEDRDLHVG